MGANFPSSWRNNENDRVASPESVPIHLKKIIMELKLQKLRITCRRLSSLSFIDCSRQERVIWAVKEIIFHISPYHNNLLYVATPHQNPHAKTILMRGQNIFVEK